MTKDRKLLGRRQLRDWSFAELVGLLAENRYRARRVEPAARWLSWCGMIRAEMRRRAAD